MLRVCNRSTFVGATDNDGRWDEEGGLERSEAINSVRSPSFGHLGMDAVRSSLNAIPASIRRRFDAGSGIGAATAGLSEPRTAAGYVAARVESEVSSLPLAYLESISDFLIRKRVDSLLEDCISLYRTLLPAPLWLSYFASGPHAVIGCGVLSAVKARDLFEAALHLYNSIAYLAKGELVRQHIISVLFTYSERLFCRSLGGALMNSKLKVYRDKRVLYASITTRHLFFFPATTHSASIACKSGCSVTPPVPYADNPPQNLIWIRYPKMRMTHELK